MRFEIAASLTSRSALRYLAVGIVNTIFGLGLIYTTMYLFGLGNAQANMLGYFAGILLSFVLNRRWTFQHKGPTAPAFAKFIVVTVVAYLVNLATVLFLADALGINRYLAQAAGIPPYTLVGYLGARLFAFKTAEGA
jgi:putative flippase GtrA